MNNIHNCFGLLKHTKLIKNKYEALIVLKLVFNMYLWFPRCPPQKFTELVLSSLVGEFYQSLYCAAVEVNYEKHKCRYRTQNE